MKEFDLQANVSLSGQMLIYPGSVFPLKVIFPHYAQSPHKQDCNYFLSTPACYKHSDFHIKASWFT